MSLLSTRHDYSSLELDDNSSLESSAMYAVAYHGRRLSDADLCSPYPRSLSAPRPYCAYDYMVPPPRQKLLGLADQAAWSLNHATCYLMSYLRDPDNARIVMRTLREARSPYCVKGRLRDHAVDAFHVFEKAIFAGKLKPLVRLRWDHLPGDITGATFAPDPLSPDFPKINICLNADVLRNSSQDDIIGSLLHQMIHAYFLAVCKHTTTKDGSDERLDHGKHFGAIMYEIKNAAAKAQSSRHPLPLNFGQKVLYPQHGLWQGLRRGLQYGYDMIGLRDLDQDCSDCQTDVKTIDASEIDSWYSKICEPAFKRETTVHCLVDGLLVAQPRSLASPADEFVEFIYDNKAIVVPRRSAEQHASLKKHFADNKRELQIPAIPMDVFKTLCTFVSKESYGPELYKVQELDGKGPPIIRKHDKSFPEYLVLDLRMYKLGKAVGFDELAKTALKRLNAQHFTHNDPIAALKEIYDPKTFYPSTVAPKDKDNKPSDTSSNIMKKDPPAPDPTLRDWALAWLKRHTKPKPTQAFLATSNLATLQTRKNDDGETPFTALCDAFDTTLANDVAKAHKYFAQLGHLPLPPPREYLYPAAAALPPPGCWVPVPVSAAAAAPTAPGLAYPLRPAPLPVPGAYAAPAPVPVPVPHPQIGAQGFLHAVEPGKWSKEFRDPGTGLWVRVRGGTGEAVAWDEGREEWVPLRRGGAGGGAYGAPTGGEWVFVDW